jgi:hypothetical protein
VKGTKTERVRSVPLSAIALDALRRQKAAQARDRLAAGGEFVDLGYVFIAPEGGTPVPYDFSEAFRVLAKRAKVSSRRSTRCGTRRDGADRIGRRR